MLASYVRPPKQLWVDLTAENFSIISESDHDITAPLCTGGMLTLQLGV